MTGFIQTFLIGVGLSADAFAVAVCQGLNMRRLSLRQAFIIALFFGGFQALMPYVGWLATSFVEDIVSEFSHWISFALLAFIGGKMIYEALTEKDERCDCKTIKLDYKQLVILAIATSIDALAAGVAFALDGTNIYFAITVIGLTTFALSFAGVAVGNKFGTIYQKKAEIAGGVVLVIIGIKILLEHFFTL